CRRCAAAAAPDERRRPVDRLRPGRGALRPFHSPRRAALSAQTRALMNYRHAFHAGNFADVLKHAVLGRIVAHLQPKPAAFRAIDTHAGAGLYDLDGQEARRSGEWRAGIGRLLDGALEPALATLLSPYLDVVHALNPGGGVRAYPGSAALLR